MNNYEEKDIPQTITEEMHLEKEWFEEAKKQTPETLMSFINHIMNDYRHDYGTIVHAVSACALAAAWASDRYPQGGITGFQAGFVMWDFIRELEYSNNECGLKIVNYDNMLYPQYKDRFEKIIPKWVWEKLQERAKEKLENLEQYQYTSGVVIAHWKSIADGKVPFGYSVEE